MAAILPAVLRERAASRLTLAGSPTRGPGAGRADGAASAEQPSPCRDPQNLTRGRLGRVFSAVLGEVLGVDQLLELNHERYAEEIAQVCMTRRREAPRSGAGTPTRIVCSRREPCDVVDR